MRQEMYTSLLQDMDVTENFFNMNTTCPVSVMSNKHLEKEDVNGPVNPHRSNNDLNFLNALELFLNIN